MSLANQNDRFELRPPRVIDALDNDETDKIGHRHRDEARRKMPLAHQNQGINFGGFREGQGDGEQNQDRIRRQGGDEVLQTNDKPEPCHPPQQRPDDRRRKAIQNDIDDNNGFCRPKGAAGASPRLSSVAGNVFDPIRNKECISHKPFRGNNRQRSHHD